MARIKIEDIRAELKKDNWKVISEEYVNLDTTMIFECPEGHKVYSPWKKIRQKRECPICKRTYSKLNEQKIIPKLKEKTRVLALDQATYKTGWSVYDEKQLIKFGVFETTLKDEIERDNAIKNWLISMIDNWKPDIIGVEGIQLQEKSEERKMGVTVFETLARLQGILMETCYERKIPFKICPPNVWRKHCAIKGRSRTDRKRSMQLLIKKWYDITISDDEADAIGIGKYLSDIFINYKIENWEQ